MPFETGEETATAVQEMLARMRVDAFPHLTEYAVERALQPGSDFGDEFEVGLELILDGLERALTVS